MAQNPVFTKLNVEINWLKDFNSDLCMTGFQISMISDVEKDF